MTNFFSELANLGLKAANLQLVFGDNGEVTVILKPEVKVKDSSMQHLSPLVFRAESVELADSDFFEDIKSPISSFVSKHTNFEKFETELEETTKESDMAKKSKEKEQKEKEALKKKIESAEKMLDAITGTEGFDIQKEKDKVQRAVNGILELDPKNKKALEFQEELKKEQEPDLFGAGELDNLTIK